jgi:phage terminase large subunit
LSEKSKLTLKIPYKPYWYQKDFENAMKAKKRAVLCWARRHGKDLACWNYLILEALSKKGVYYYIFPEYAQARRAFWDSITEDGIAYLDFIPKQVIDRRLNQEMKLYLINGSVVQVLGSDNYDAIRGTNPTGVVLSEYAYQNPNVWHMILDPILSKNKGWAIFNSTPNGKNHFYDLYNYALDNPDEYFVSKVTNEETNFISQHDIERKSYLGQSDEFIEQEYYCSFEIGVHGSYYGKWLRNMYKENRICNVPYDKDFLVYTAFDLGFTDSTSIVFFQKKGAEIHIIDFYENRGYQLNHYLNVLREKEYVYGKHFVPHDGKAHDRTGNTFVQKAREAGFQMTVLPLEKSILAGIERVRSYMPNFFIDKKKCDYLIRCLLEYHAEYDQKTNIFKNIPKHNWASHAADSIRYLSQALENLSYSSMTPEKLSKLRKEAFFEPPHV